MFCPKVWIGRRHRWLVQFYFFLARFFDGLLSVQAKCIDNFDCNIIR
ncbi:hypothetical protein DSUL_260042 [Desulfovibrionales bacterium]